MTSTEISATFSAAKERSNAMDSRSPGLSFTVGIMIRMIDLTKLFGLIFELTFGGPGGATETMAFTTYLVGFNDMRMSYAAALSYVIVAGVLVLTLLFMWVQRRREMRV